MANIPLSFACGSYDRMAALKEGAVEIDGVDLDFVAIRSPREIFDRMVGNHEFGASELSCSEFIAMIGAGDCPFVALPIFPSKAFRHGFICINTNAGINAPKDLEGKRIGVPLHTQTAAIWIRGHLCHEYGIDLASIQWVQGAVEHGGNHGTPHARPLLKPANIETNDSGKSLSDLLAAGEIDALIGSRLPETLGKHECVQRLFPDFREVEKDYYRRTGIHPIMHLVAMRKDVYAEHPWLAERLYRACTEAKDMAFADMSVSAAQRYMLPWLYADLAEIDEVFGGDPWPYGVEANRKTLEALIAYMVEQDFIAEPIAVDDLFVPVGE